MTFTNRQYAEALYQALQETNDAGQDAVIDNLVQLLSESGDLHRYEVIIAEFEALDREMRGVVQVQATVSREENSQAIMDALNAALGDKAEVKVQVDSGIIGGAILRMDDTLIDASVARKLQKLNEDLSQ